MNSAAKRLAASGVKLNTLSERLAWAMAQKGVGQSDLARAVGIRQGTIESLLSGRSKRTTYLAEIAWALDISSTWLAMGHGTPTPWAQASQTARVVARRFDELDKTQQEEIIGYMDYITARSGDARTARSLRAIIEDITK